MNKNERTTQVTTYGRKIIRDDHMKKSESYKILYISWAVCIMLGMIIGILFTLGMSVLFKEDVTEAAFQGEADDRMVIEDAEVDFVPLNVPMDEDMQRYVYQLSEYHNMEFHLVMALIFCESSFRTDVTSNTGDYGLMQINEINHEWLTEELGITDILDPYQNIKSGMFILGRLWKKYEDPARVLMAYNMGETGARRLWDKGIFETKYSNRIIEKSAEYQQQILERKGELNAVHG